MNYIKNNYERIKSRSISNGMKKIYAIIAIFAFLGFAGSVFAAAPVVNLRSADNITETSATLSVSTTSSSTVTYIFEYGTDASFGVSTMLPTSSTSVNLTGLTANTNYYYRVQASNNDGSTVAPVNSSGAPSYYSFKTLNYKSTLVDTLGADNLTNNSATLNGRINNYGVSGTYYFRYYAGSTCASYLGNTNTQSIGGSNSIQYISASLTGLSAGQTYCAQLVGTFNGTEYPDSKISFVTKTSGSGSNTNSCVINNFDADNNSISYGSSTILRWNTTNCTSASLTNIGSVAVDDSRSTGVLYSTTRYTLTASGSIGSDSKTISVSVGSNNNNPGTNYPACYYTYTCYWNGTNWVYSNNNYNNQPACVISGQCYWNGSSWVYYNNNNNNNNVNTFTGTYPSCYYDASCYWSGSIWVYNVGGNVIGNYAPYVYNPHTPYTGGPNYVTRTVSGGVRTVYVDEPVTNYVPNNNISYVGGNYGYDTNIMSRYSANYYDGNVNNRVLLTGSAGSAGQITLIGLLIAIIIILVIVYVIKTTSEKNNN
jgi:hypothetical protein